MKRFILFSLAMLMLLPNSFLSLAKEGCDEGEPIPIQYLESGEGDEKVDLRNLITPPLEAILLPSNQVEIYFLDDIGEVSICLTNLTTNTTSSTMIDSENGFCVIPITMGLGFYRIEFHADDGTSYYGYFNVQ